jgi:hypothetical protein
VIIVHQILDAHDCLTGGSLDAVDAAELQPLLYANEEVFPPNIP